MKNLTIILAVFAVLAGYGCGPKQMYYYGSYSNTLYDYRKEASHENLMKHIKEMENIINESNEQGMRVPPGLYGELGFMHLKAKDKKKAIEYS